MTDLRAGGRADVLADRREQAVDGWADGRAGGRVVVRSSGQFDGRAAIGDVYITN